MDQPTVSIPVDLAIDAYAALCAGADAVEGVEGKFEEFVAYEHTAAFIAAILEREGHADAMLQARHTWPPHIEDRWTLTAVRNPGDSS